MTRFECNVRSKLYNARLPVKVDDRTSLAIERFDDSDDYITRIQSALVFLLRQMSSLLRFGVAIQEASPVA
jgi:hypothetical protein